MNRPSHYLSIACGLIAFAGPFVSCETTCKGYTDPPPFFDFPYETIEIPLDRTRCYSVAGNSFDYSAVPGDTGIASVTVSGDKIFISGNALGTTALTVTDNASGEWVEAAVRVTDYYMGLYISGGPDNGSFLRRNDRFFLTDNATRDFHLYRGTYDPSQGTYEDYKLLRNGRFGFRSEDGMLLLELFGKGGTPEPIAVFDLGQTEAGALNLLRAHFGSDGATPGSIPSGNLYLVLREKNSGKRFDCRIADELFLPDNITDQKYRL